LTYLELVHAVSQILILISRPGTLGAVVIIVVCDDRTIRVLPDFESVRRDCEPVDVEDGLYRFFDELGRRLVPRFIKPAERVPWRFGEIIGDGEFELELDLTDTGFEFDAEITGVVAIRPNPRFATTNDLARYVAENRQQQR
jgi:hypothetical protein